MIVCKGPRKRLGALVYSNLLAFSAADTVRGADLPPPAPPATEAPFPFSFHGFYVRFGVEGILNESSSNLYSQTVGGVTTPGGAFIPVGGVGPQLFLAGRGATYSNVLTASFQSGYFFTPNWSVEISGGVPIWVSLKINGFSAQPPVAGTVLAKILPGGIPITGVYHFTQFGPFQPYLGAGVSPSFLFASRDGFSTGGWFKPVGALVLQAGFDYMFTRNWGVNFDVKKTFAEATGTANGTDLGPPIGTIPVTSTIKTSFRPWLFATQVTYRF